MKSDKIYAAIIICLHLAYCTSIQTKKAQDNERDPGYQVKKAEISMKYGLMNEAIKYLNQALSLDPTYYQAYYLLGVVFYRGQRFEEAASAFQSCLGVKPDYSDAHSGLASVYEEMGLLEKAEEEFKDAYAIGSSHDACLQLAEIYFKQDKMTLALDYAQEAILKNDQSADAYNLEGVILNQNGDYAKAIVSFSNALSINPNFVVARINLGVSYINHQEPKKARTLLKETLPLTDSQQLKDKINRLLEMIKKETKPDSD
jgi:tetratricopeptide (TPR) repeat protein